MVGFTRRGEVVSASELGALADRLEAAARDVGDGDVMVVKVIGDAAMLVSGQPGRLIEAVLRLLAHGLDPDVDLPPMRAGAAFGEAVRRGGDYFGHVVNVASRLTALAQPNCLAADEALFRATEHDTTWKAGGPRQLRGVRRPVEVYLSSPEEARR
jgi:adenylate cyclase